MFIIVIIFLQFLLPNLVMNLKQNNINNLLQQGLMHHQKGQFNQAQSIYKKILKHDPKNFEALQLNAALNLQQKKFKAALKLFKLALSINPSVPYVNFNYGNVLHNLKLLDEALQSYDQAIKLKPDYVEAFYNRGIVLDDLKRFDEALQSYDQAIYLKSNYAEIFFNRGIVLEKLKRFHEALQSYDQAIYLKSNYAEAFFNRGNALLNLKRNNEALQSYDQAINLNPNYAEAHNNRGNALQDLKRNDEALQSLDQAINLNPNYAEAISNKAYLKLRLGEFEEGWKLYEYRKNKKDKIHQYPKFSQPLWLGNVSIQGKTILIHSEQGLGDTIQFYRYLPLLKSLKPKNIIFHLENQLIPLFSSLKNEITFLEIDKPLPSFDFYCPLMSLPLAFNTTLETIPSNIPYLNVDEFKNKYWQDRLGRKTKTRIGLVWSGSIAHKKDHDRSLRLNQFLNLLNLPYEFHSLQKEIRDYDQKTLEELGSIFQYQNDLNDLSDTAGLLNQMDLIISVDTSVAHLAGALGKKVWILLPFVPDFRWLFDLEYSPWYPTARLFRQSQRGNWDNVFHQLKNELNKQII